MLRAYLESPKYLENSGKTAEWLPNYVWTNACVFSPSCTRSRDWEEPEHNRMIWVRDEDSRRWRPQLTDTSAAVKYLQQQPTIGRILSTIHSIY